MDNTEYHINGNDGDATSWFEPKLDQSDVFQERLWHEHDTWGKTDELYLKEGICFVAGWRTAETTQATNDTDGDGIADEHDKPDFRPVYMRTHVDTITETQLKITLFVQLRNLGQEREPYYGALDVHWEPIQAAGPMQRGTPASPGSGPQVAVNPLYPDSTTETVAWAGQSTLHLEHSWMVSHDEWAASDPFSEPFAFTVTVDSDDEVDELDESNNDLDVSLGAWSEEIGFFGVHALEVTFHLAPQVKERVGLVRLRTWRVHPVDASVLGDASFSAVDVARANLDEFSSILASADRGDLFAVLIEGTATVALDVMH